MSDFDIYLVGGEELVIEFESMSKKLAVELAAAMANIKDDLKEGVLDKLSGEVLNVKTGALKAAVEAALSSDGASISASVFLAGGGPPYAAIQEYGGTIDHPGGTAILPYPPWQFISNAEAALWTARGFGLRRTAPHPIEIPERSYFRSTLADMMDDIETEIDEAIARATAR